MEQVKKVFIFVTKALPKHQRTDHVGHSPAHEEGNIYWCGCGPIKTHYNLFILTALNAAYSTSISNAFLGCSLHSHLVSSKLCTKYLLSSWVHSSILLRPIPKSLSVVRVKRLRCCQRSPLLMIRPTNTTRMMGQNFRQVGLPSLHPSLIDHTWTSYSAAFNWMQICADGLVYDIKKQQKQFKHILSR